MNEFSVTSQRFLYDASVVLLTTDTPDPYLTFVVRFCTRISLQIRTATSRFFLCGKHCSINLTIIRRNTKVNKPRTISLRRRFRCNFKSFFLVGQMLMPTPTHRDTHGTSYHCRFISQQSSIPRSDRSSCGSGWEAVRLSWMKAVHSP